MRIFVLGFPHTQTVDPRDEDIVNLCPFTEQVGNFIIMMHRLGHEVIHIGMPGSKPPEGVEHIDAMDQQWWDVLYGWRDPLAPFILSRVDAYGRQWDMYEENVRKILLERGGDSYTSIVACLWGHQGCVKDIPQIVVDCGIGSPHAHAPFRVYLSNAWRHFHEGVAQNYKGDKWWHQVIPLALNLDMFGPVVPTADKHLNGSPYFLVQTRMLEPKGVRLAVQVARELQTPIILTGRDDKHMADSFVAEWPTGAQYAGISTPRVRRELMRHAKALLSPSRYVEPYGAVAIEAMASGCPVISTDFGGYVDTVVHGYTGWRCNTFEEFVWAARNVDKIDPFVCREWIEKNHSFDVVGRAYEDYFTSLLRLNSGKGFLDAEPAAGRTMLGRAFRDYSMFGKRG